MDLSNAFETIKRDLFIAKLYVYGFGITWVMDGTGQK